MMNAGRFILIVVWHLVRWLGLSPTEKESATSHSGSAWRNLDNDTDFSHILYEQRAPRPLIDRKEHTVSDELDYLTRQLRSWTARTAAYTQRHNYTRQQNALLKRQGASGWEYHIIFDDPETRAAVNELRDILIFMDRLCIAYWEANANWREWLRQADNPLRYLWLGHYVDMQTNAAQAVKDVEPLRIALAAVSINNWTRVSSQNLMASDEPDMSREIGITMSTARNIGLDLNADMLKMANLSSDKPSRAHPNSISMREFILQRIEGV